jgi:hypothetical protein
MNFLPGSRILFVVLSIRSRKVITMCEQHWSNIGVARSYVGALNKLGDSKREVVSEQFGLRHIFKIASLHTKTKFESCSYLRRTKFVPSPSKHTSPDISVCRHP